MSAEPENTEEQKPSGPGLKTLIKAGAFIGVIVVAECVVASMLLPSAEDTIEIAKRIAAEANGLDGSSDSLDTKKTANVNNLREVSLGPFSVTSYIPATNSTLRIDFELYATVNSNDESTFVELFEQNQHRLSEQVHSTFRGSELTDLTDEGLGLIKRRIREKCNRTLGKPVLHEIIFSKLLFMES